MSWAAIFLRNIIMIAIITPGIYLIYGADTKTPQSIVELLIGVSFVLNGCIFAGIFDYVYEERKGGEE